MDGVADGRIVATTRRAMGQVSRKEPQLPGAGNQPVAEIAVPFQELGTKHGGNVPHPGTKGSAPGLKRRAYT